MRNMSFALTTPAILSRTKTVTRRLGWAFLKPGELVQAIEKGQGLRKGEKVRRLCVIRIVSVRRERLDALLGLGSLDARRELEREGLSILHPKEFVQLVCKANGCQPDAEVTRIAFDYFDGPVLR